MAEVKITRRWCQGQGGVTRRGGEIFVEKVCKKFWQKICIQIFVFTVRVKGNCKVFRRSIRVTRMKYFYISSWGFFLHFPIISDGSFECFQCNCLHSLKIYVSHNQIYIYRAYCAKKFYFESIERETRCIIRFRFEILFLLCIYDITLHKMMSTLDIEYSGFNESAEEW